MSIANLEIIEGPEVEPISIEMIKAHLRLYADLDGDEDLLALYLTAAREYLESVTARSFIRTLVRETRIVPADGVVRLLRSPIIEIESVTVGGVDLTSETSLRLGIRVDVGAGYAGREVVIVYSSGYGDDPADVPARAKQALLLQIANAYERREPTVVGASVAELPFALQALISSLSSGVVVAL